MRSGVVTVGDWRLSRSIGERERNATGQPMVAIGVMAQDPPGKLLLEFTNARLPLILTRQLQRWEIVTLPPTSSQTKADSDE